MSNKKSNHTTKTATTAKSKLTPKQIENLKEAFLEAKRYDALTFQHKTPIKHDISEKSVYIFLSALIKLGGTNTKETIADFRDALMAAVSLIAIVDKETVLRTAYLATPKDHIIHELTNLYCLLQSLEREAIHEISR